MIKLPIVFFAVFLFISCATVKQFEREYLADPIMDTEQELTKQSLETKFFSSREGSIGGDQGIGGGCGCAK